MKVVYTAGRFRGKNPWVVHCNVARAEQAALQVAQVGAMPLCPHTNTKNFDGLLTSDFWIEGTLELMKRCDAILVFDPFWHKSSGTLGEMQIAYQNKIPVFMSIEHVAAWVATDLVDEREQTATYTKAQRFLK